jgi:hypothetical protein
MLLQHNASRCQRSPKARYRVTNWPVFEFGLRRRGDLTFWLDEAALAGWTVPWAVSHLVATTSKAWLHATQSRVTPEQLAAIRRQIALAVGIRG